MRVPLSIDVRRAYGKIRFLLETFENLIFLETEHDNEIIIVILFIYFFFLIGDTMRRWDDTRRRWRIMV